MATPEAVAEKRELAGINADYKEKFGFHDSETGYAYKAPKGLSREVVESISEYKDEPQWMRDFRLKALQHFEDRPTPTWGGNLGQIDFDDIHYFVRASERSETSWDEVPDDIVARKYEERFLHELQDKPRDRELLDAFADAVGDPVLEELNQPVQSDGVEEALDVRIEHPVHLLPHDPHPQRVQRIMC